MTNLRSLAELIHPTRIKILNLIQYEPKMLGEIAKDLDLSKPEISRHLTRLRDHSLITSQEKFHKITKLGEDVISILAPLEFIVRYYDFFKTHQLLDLPPLLVREIDALNNSTLVSGTGYIMKKIEEIGSYISQEFKLMIDQPFPRRELKQKIGKANFILPSYAQAENVDIKTLQLDYECLETRTLPKIYYALGIADKKFAILYFPDQQGNVDFNHAFLVNDSLGIEFLLKIWDYYWYKATYKKEFSFNLI